MDLTGKIIVSVPSLEDERFFKTVIYMCAHSSEGSMGIIINKQFNELKLNGTIEEVLIKEDFLKDMLNDIYFGGPVLLDKGIVLHHSCYMSDSSVAISKSIAITSKQDVLIDLQQEKDVPFKLMLGHAGWSPGQLEKEIKNGDWLMQNTTADFIFNVPPNQMWKQATESLSLDLGPSFGMAGQA